MEHKNLSNYKTMIVFKNKQDKKTSIEQHAYDLCIAHYEKCRAPLHIRQKKEYQLFYLR